MSYIGNQPLYTSYVTDRFSGNGSTLAYTLSIAPANSASLLVAIYGVLQDPSAYGVVGNTLTFTSAPPAGTNNISVRYLGLPASNVVTSSYRTVTDIIATAGQTTFSPAGYTPGFIDVYRNGSKLATADFTATNGAQVVLVNAASAGDIIQTVSFSVGSVLNAIPANAGVINSGYLAAGNASTTFLDSGNFNGTGALLVPSGSTAQRPAIPVAGMIRYNTTLGGAETYTSAGWINTTRLGTQTNPAPNASAIIAAGASTGDGVYWYRPTNYAGVAFPAWTDMTNYGGGWVIVSKWYQDAPYTVDELYNGNERNTVDLLTGNQLTSKAAHARLSRAQMNALWNDSKYVARCLVTTGAQAGTYFQKKITNTTNFDFWNAHYNSRAWSDDITASASYIQYPGTTYKVMWQEAHGNIFNTVTNDFVQPSVGNGPGWWDYYTVAAPNVGTIYATRHMGFFGDITQGNQWILTNNPSDSRFTSADSIEGRQTIVYLRT